MSEWAAIFPDFTLGILKLSALQAWLHKESEHAETCRRVLEDAGNTSDPVIAERAAKCYSLIPSSDPRLVGKALTLARRVVDLGQDDPWFCWYLLGLGMAEYRQSNFLSADKALLSAISILSAVDEATSNTGAYRPVIRVTARLYLTMSLLHQKKISEARDLFVTVEAQMKCLPVGGQPPKACTDHDDLICGLAYKEAKALLETNP